MPTRRTPLKRATRARISDAVIEAFIRVCKIQDAGLNDCWESECGRRREMLDLSVELEAALGLKPWEVSPLDVDDDGPAPLWENEGSWLQAQTLRRALVAVTFQTVETG